MKDSLLFLGTGSSTGIPVIGCECSQCRSNNPKDLRLRPSVLLHYRGKQLLIDAGPDLRRQALEYGITHLDGVLLTHTHFDHVGGVDELRAFNFRTKKELPILASLPTLESLKSRYDYLFLEKSEGISLSARLNFHLLEGESGETTFCDVPIAYTTYEQGGVMVTGYRFGDLAYVTDVKNYPPTLFHDLKGVDTLIVNCLREAVSPMHLSVEEAIAFSQKVGAKRTYFTHIGHEMSHKVDESLPKGFSLAYDGLELVECFHGS